MLQYRNVTALAMHYVVSLGITPFLGTCFLGNCCELNKAANQLGTFKAQVVPHTLLVAAGDLSFMSQHPSVIRYAS